MYPHGEIVTPEIVRSIIEQRFKLNQLPLNAKLCEFDLNGGDLLQLRVVLYKTLGLDVRVRPNDTIYQLTDSLNSLTNTNYEN